MLDPIEEALNMISIPTQLFAESKLDRIGFLRGGKFAQLQLGAPEVSYAIGFSGFEQARSPTPDNSIAY
ncbi:MAG: hypothetical protein MPJ78_11755 [Hyphomicrobiaceae bacterium]|nr:hypothetical protein [Hyphomicrobiaceae bacterium]